MLFLVQCKRGQTSNLYEQNKILHDVDEKATETAFNTITHSPPQKLCTKPEVIDVIL